MAQQIVVISNPTSGTGSGARVAQQAAERPDVLVVVGGAGTVHLALQPASDTDVRLGLVPTGTDNDVARALDGHTEQMEATMVAVGNGPSSGGGLRITEGAELDDGLLDVVVIAPLSRREPVRTYPRLFRGTHVSHPPCSRHRVRQVRVAAPGTTAYADGERIGALPPSVGVEAGALRVPAGAGR